MGNQCLQFSSPLSMGNQLNTEPSLVTHRIIGSLPRTTPKSPSKKFIDVRPKESNRLSILSIKQEPSTKLSQYPKRLIIQNYTIVCLITTIDENQIAINYLQRTFHSCRIFINIDDFFAFILQMKEENLFLILSEIFAKKILSFIHKTSQLIAIYILSKTQSQNHPWIVQYPKLQGIYLNIESICQSIQYKLQLSEYNTISHEIHDSSTIIVQYLIHQCLLSEIISNEKSRNNFFNFVRQQYPNEFDIINEFEEYYRPSKAIWWYTRKCFLYHALDKAFYHENIEELFLMRFFIQDLHQQITQTCEEIHLNSPKFVYRGQGILEKDLIQMKNIDNIFFTFKNFFWATSDKNHSLRFAQSERYKQHQSCGVLYRIEIPASMKLISLEQSSYYLNSKNEFLFSIDSLFRISEIQQIDEQLWQIDLILIDKNDVQSQEYLKTIENIEGETFWQKSGVYLIELKQFSKAENFYQALILSNSITNLKQIALVHEQLGFIYYKKIDSTNSLLHYRKSLKIYLTILSLNDPSLLPIYLNLGTLLQEQKQFNEAIKHLKCALNIALHFFPHDHLQIANIYHYLAEIYEEDGIFVDAIQHYQFALENELHFYPSYHCSIAKTYNRIGEMFHRINDYSTAFSYFNKTLNIQKKILPPNHRLLATTNYNLARTLNGLQDYKEAIEYASQALNIARHTFGSDHDDVRLYENYLRKLRRNTLIGVIPNGAVYE
ncbi:hypothetical protein I4U23_009073 [Adineta vaga]|nr:hypothetical protein I4U23_009073 [Adineta vaga]